MIKVVLIMELTFSTLENSWKTPRIMLSSVSEHHMELALILELVLVMERILLLELVLMMKQVLMMELY